MLENLLDVSLAVFIGITVLVMGFAAFMTGQALAANWKPLRQLVLYSALLGIAARFFALSLFYGDPFFMIGRWAYGAVIDTAVMIAIALFAYRMTRVSMMLKQYPWLYRRAGLFSYQSRNGT